MNIKRYGRSLALVHGTYYLFTALWALIDIQSFMAVTGQKTDIWLVKTIAWLLLGFSFSLLLTRYRGGISLSLAILAILNATFLAGVDFYYVFNGTIGSIYLVDGAIEALFATLWIIFVLF